MWRVWLVACVACSFEHGSAPTTSTRIDAPRAVDGAAACPGDYNLAFGGHVYKLVNNVDWDTAKITCLVDQGHLVKIEDMLENDFLHNQIGSGFAWIGLRDTMMNDTFYWTDGTALGSFQNFSGSTASSTRDCVDMGATAGTWAVYTCASAELALCECP
jgi:hypothetical protein